MVGSPPPPAPARCVRRPSHRPHRRAATDSRSAERAPRCSRWPNLRPQLPTYCRPNRPASCAFPHAIALALIQALAYAFYALFRRVAYSDRIKAFRLSSGLRRSGNTLRQCLLPPGLAARPLVLIAVAGRAPQPPKFHPPGAAGGGDPFLSTSRGQRRLRRED